MAAGVSGTGILIFIAAVLRRVYRLENVIDVAAFRWLGTFLWVMIVVVLYFVISEELTSLYAGGEKERAVATALVSGPYALSYRLEIGSFVLALIILFAQFALGRTSVALTAFAGLLVNVGAVLKRFLLVVPSQTHGTLLPWPVGHYAPNTHELGVVLGFVCLGVLLFSIFIWVFPIIPISGHASRGEIPRDPRRMILSALTLFGGITLAVVGFSSSARLGTKAYLDPVIPFSPVMFIFGVMLIFGAAAVYELVPSRRKQVTGP
jgi:molybdopterin-containing oxidoreductase family membrane subunit